MITSFIRYISTPIKLIAIEKEASDTYTFKFEVPDKVTWTPGSYAHFVCSNLPKGVKFKKDLLHELSIMSHPDEKYIAFTTRIRQDPSIFKKTMQNLKVGDEIRMFKIGNHFKKEEAENPIVFISMGVGIATFRPLIWEHLKVVSQKLSLININIDRTGDFVYQKELENLSKEYLKNSFVTTRNDLYNTIDQYVDNKECTYYIVGSEAFNNGIGNYLLQKNVSAKNIIFDKH